jgi:hypothetical protein
VEARQQIERAQAELLAYGFGPYFTDRALDTLRIGDLPAGVR